MREGVAMVVKLGGDGYDLQLWLVEATTPPYSFVRVKVRVW